MAKERKFQISLKPDWRYLTFVTGPEEEKMNSKFENSFKEQGFTKPTLIQEQVYEPLKEGKSVLGLAPTGSGKTLAYLLPLLEQVDKAQGVQLVIVAPSQELAAQITEVARQWAKLVDLTVLSLIGGANVKRQIEKLKKAPEVVIGTPGRMLELAENKKLKLHNVKAFVFDEADDLLTEQTLVACRSLLNHAPGIVQLAFFSATKSDIFDQLHQWFGTEVEVFDVRAEDQTQGEVEHFLVETPVRKRIDTLRKLSNLEKFSALVFFKKVTEIENAADKLKYLGVKVAVLEGQQRQVEREKALRQLRKGEISLLLTTDVAARGLDIVGLPAVINYDLPKDSNTYIHRVGRTGRMGASGIVINLGNDHDLRNFRQLVQSENYELHFGTVYRGALLRVEEIPDEVRESQLSKSKTEPVQRKKKKIVSPVIVEKKKHKKRKRDRLNKGKRHKKENQ
ncbi:DEAD/DEAH box helicase [Liquorilactobacillus mali]|uniref:ATP-dependent RNA helicase n=2 Tax=Liquorilactobacillus mali TaxID=1618 RepID=J1F436_9LACO|nr:ATP-dependent RNA helicase [Liquorilactobacillus mali KCTC 3596 = DSM 20444]KRN10178.1 ATP-dependent RNA helicase [Liquorilactobacillus mali KCTC 3596 = DSM 20444]QFQ74050.1 DEAD/DEAH box helicase [Liquorilactobacillus mali]